MSNTINLRNQTPMQNINRILFCQSLKEIGVEKIEALNRKHEVFLLPCEDEENGTYNVIDWEFVLFEATHYQMADLLSHFERKAKV